MERAEERLRVLWQRGVQIELLWLRSMARVEWGVSPADGRHQFSSSRLKGRVTIAARVKAMVR